MTMRLSALCAAWCLRVSVVAASAEEPPLTSAQPFVLPRSVFDTASRSLASGQRLEREPGGRVRVGRERFPEQGQTQALPLPTEWGGGYLFFQVVSEENETGTALWWSSTWTGELEPWARFPFVTSRIVVGFDRLYVFGGGDVRGFDVFSRKWTDGGIVPPVPSLTDLRFVQGGKALLESPLLGRRVSSDGGLNWRADPGGFDWDARAPVVSPRPFRDGAGESTREILLYGVARGNRLLALRGARLLELDLELEEGVRVQERELDRDYGDCRGVEGAADPLFLCWKGAQTQLHVITGERPSLRFELSGARSLWAQSSCGLWLEGACETGESGSCLVRFGASSGERGSSCRDGIVSAQTIPARAQASLARGVGRTGAVFLERRSPDRLELVSAHPNGKVRRFVLSEESDSARLLGQGQWLPELIETEEGWLGWASLGEELVGVLLTEEGKITTGPIQRRLRRTLFAGSRALLWGAAGFAKETLDGGLTWRELFFPFRSGDPDPSVPSGAGADLFMGCSAAGCVVGEQLRFGWGEPEGSPRRQVAIPERLAVPPQGGGRFRFSCEKKRSERGVSGAGTSSLGGKLQEKTPTPKRFFVEASDEQGWLWASGPKEGSWAREGRVVLTYRDPFGGGRLRSSAPTQGLFPDAARAEEALGLLGSNASLASIQLLSDGSGGFFLISSHQRAELFSFTEGGPVEHLSGATELGVRRLSGAARSGGHWYTAYRSRENFEVLRVDRGQLSPVAAFPLGDAGGRTIDLVQTTGGGLGIAVDGDAGLFVYALSESGELGDFVLAPHRGSRPRTCEVETPGYTVVRPLNISPAIEHRGSSLDVTQVIARYRVGPGWLCLDALAGRSRKAWSETAAATNPARAEVAARPRSAGELPVPLTITDFSSETQEWSCE